MKITTGTFNVVDIKQNRIHVHGFSKLTGTAASSLRQALYQCLNDEYEIMHIDARDVAYADLSGMNEIIHAGYVLQQKGKQLLFIYRRNSVVEKWVQTIALDNFITTALLP